MQNFRQKMAAFFYGRYGMDALNYALDIAWSVFFLLFILTRLQLFDFLGLACLVIVVYRMMSRNIVARQRENLAFRRIWTMVKDFFRLQYNRVRDVRTSVYRRCPDCHAVLRLPRRSGTHTAVCPRCGKRFDVRILF